MHMLFVSGKLPQWLADHNLERETFRIKVLDVTYSRSQNNCNNDYRSHRVITIIRD